VETNFQFAYLANAKDKKLEGFLEVHGGFCVSDLATLLETGMLLILTLAFVSQRNARLEYLIADESDESDEDDLLSYYAAVHRPIQTRKSWTALSDADFIRISRFEKSDFENLRRALRIPDQANTGNRLAFEGRTALLITLQRCMYAD
jgi:hypothetical protein